jgi:hypothetical protein
MDEDILAVDRRQAQIGAGILHLIAGPPVADLEIDDVALRAIDQLMAVRYSGGKSGGRAGAQDLRAGIGD